MFLLSVRSGKAPIRLGPTDRRIGVRIAPARMQAKYAYIANTTKPSECFCIRRIPFKSKRARLCGFDNLAVAIEAAVGAHTMRQLGFAALRAHRTRRCGNLVVFGTAGVVASTTRLAFRYCHGYLLT